MNYQVINQLNETQISELVELYKNEFWSHNRTYQGVIKMLAASDIIIALVTEQKELIGFCRILTDFVYRGVIYDVIVKPSYRKIGFGAKLLDEVVNHPQLKEVENIALFCLPEMIPFYQRWGFTDVVKLELMYRYQ
ncbi:GNAT family N-acetyltransferase [Dolichospermum sp. ST_con]|nr:GNAT family N-acetyltransferase [Dolichospermum sp. ST_con]MDD1419694.1 GNAT family N-acetyltransferase [Dolichospermum sp. ST_sed1]MDD1425083.1 GNAT family N-acetyltransferase [Dolichospermum sp. ST_sed9]MDD1431853.1 GNAT family N-acetyltransferase [Dolichospermum sp. ST_sed6]MDD1441170.1 GNAT family N-acetyltransferase [Dolichospermum sp. ST_sed3]MDD1446575.1 GNAT family N-acetyltransferase [Dolichospermum sp. ST_sed8]MDD1455576.1 GNAT family N-acetyltransferase [Dolichospermum sp. ST_se